MEVVTKEQMIENKKIPSWFIRDNENGKIRLNLGNFIKAFREGNEIIYYSGSFFQKIDDIYVELEEYEINVRINLLMYGNEGSEHYLYTPNYTERAIKGLKDNHKIFVKVNDSRVNPKGYLPVRNGVLNLKTRQLIEYKDCNYIFFYKSDVIYNSLAKNYEWYDGLIALHGKETIDKVLGYIGGVLGNKVINRTLFLYGQGRNLKSTLLEPIRKILGEEHNVATSTMQELTNKDFSAEALIGKNSIICTENGEATIDNSSMIKNIIVREPINIRRKNNKAISCVITGPLIFAGNHLPKFTDKTIAIERRFIFLDFTKQFDSQNVNEGYIYEVLENEDTMSSILNLVLDRGLKCENGEIELNSDKNILDRFRNKTNPFQEYFKEHFIKVEDENDKPSDLTNKIQLLYVYDGYFKYCKEELKLDTRSIEKMDTIKDYIEGMGINIVKKKVRLNIKGKDIQPWRNYIVGIALKEMSYKEYLEFVYREKYNDSVGEKLEHYIYIKSKNNNNEKKSLK